MTNNKKSIIDNSIKFEAEGLKNYCLNLFQSTIETSVKGCYSEMANKMETVLQNNLTKVLHGQGMFDQNIGSDVKDKCIYTINGHVMDLKEYLDTLPQPCVCASSRCTQIIQPCTKTAIDKFRQFIKNERLISRYTCSSDWKGAGSQYINTIDVLFTSYGRILKHTYKYSEIMNAAGRRSEEKIEYFEFNCWLPIDYIKIISTTKPSNIEEVIKGMKENLYNRKFEPLYMKEIIDENKELKDKYAKYQIDLKFLDVNSKKLEDEKKKFFEHRKKLDMELKPYIDLEKEQKALKQLRDKLDLISKKLNMDKAELEEERKKLASINVKELESIEKALLNKEKEQIEGLETNSTEDK